MPRPLGGVDHGHRGHEAIPTSVYRGDVLLRRPGLTQGPANLLDAALQDSLRHHCRGPDGLQKCLFGHDLTRLRHQGCEHGHWFGGSGMSWSSRHRLPVAGLSRNGGKLQDGDGSKLASSEQPRQTSGGRWRLCPHQKNTETSPHPHDVPARGLYTAFCDTDRPSRPGRQASLCLGATVAKVPGARIVPQWRHAVAVHSQVE